MSLYGGPWCARMNSRAPRQKEKKKKKKKKKSPLLFIIVMEAVTHTVREGLPWEMLYTDDLVLVGKCEEELKEKLWKWNECLKDKGLKINEDKPM